METNKLKIKRCKKIFYTNNNKVLGKITILNTRYPNTEHLSTQANKMRSESGKHNTRLLDNLDIPLPTRGRSFRSNEELLKFENKVEKRELINTYIVFYLPTAKCLS